MKEQDIYQTEEVIEDLRLDLEISRQIVRVSVDPELVQWHQARIDYLEGVTTDKTTPITNFGGHSTSY